MNEPTIWLGTDVRVSLDNGTYYSTHPAFSTASIQRCRVEGARLVLVARPSSINSQRVSVLDGMDAVTLLTEGRGPALIRLSRLAIRSFFLGVRRSDVVVCRIPEIVGTLLWLRGALARCGTIANHVAEGRAATGFVGAPAYGPVGGTFEFMTRRIARHSSATIYVTRKLLQRKYASTPGRPTAAISNVQLPTNWTSSQPRSYVDGQAHRFVGVGNLDSNAKGFDIAIRALADLIVDSPRASLTIVGAGANLETLRILSAQLGVERNVAFAGFVGDKKDLKEILEESDVLLAPSRSEGLPRSVLEAQAMGIACVGSDAGGLPEVLPDAGVVPSGDVDALRRMMHKLNSDGRFCSEIASIGHATANDIVSDAKPERYRQVIATVLKEVSAKHR